MNMGSIILVLSLIPSHGISSLVVVKNAIWHRVLALVGGNSMLLV